MEFQAVIKKRHTIREFADKQLNLSDIREAIQDAFCAPTYNHLKEWFYIAVDNPEIKLRLTETEKMFDQIDDELLQLFKDHDPLAREMYLNAIPKQKKMILQAPILLVAIYKPKTIISNVKKVYDLNGFASIWCSIQNLLLSLAEKNIFGVTFISKNTIKVKEILDIPEGLEVASIIPIGYKLDDSKRIIKKEIDINNRMMFNKWTM